MTVGGSIDGLSKFVVLFKFLGPFCPDDISVDSVLCTCPQKKTRSELKLVKRGSGCRLTAKVEVLKAKV